jgi:hypothetical protein
MDHETVTLWLTGLGIAGTLGAGLGSALIQRSIARRQVRDQEAADVRRSLRDERRAAYATVLDCCDEVDAALDPVIAARFQPDWDEDSNHRELWTPTNAALAALHRSVVTAEISGPQHIADLALAIYDSALEKANTMRSYGVAADERAIQFSSACGALDAARRAFVERAREALAAPNR